MSAVKHEHIFNRLETLFRKIQLGTEVEESAREGLHISECLSAGIFKFGPQYMRSLKRPATWDRLSEAERWAIDKELGILDWNGKIDE